MARIRHFESLDEMFAALEQEDASATVRTSPLQLNLQPGQWFFLNTSYGGCIGCLIGCQYAEDAEDMDPARAFARLFSIINQEMGYPEGEIDTAWRCDMTPITAEQAQDYYNAIRRALCQEPAALPDFKVWTAPHQGKSWREVSK